MGDRAERSGRVAVSAGLTSLAQGAAMLSGAILAVLVATRFGSTARTDGFFAAYGAYSVLVLFAQSSRTAIVARLVDPDSRFGAFNRFLGAAALVFAAAGLVFAGLGGSLAAVLTGDLPEPARRTARDALVILWPAAGAQIFSALAAAMLGLLGDYARAALAYGAGGIATIAAFLGLEPALGIDALPVAILIGAGVTAVPLAAALLGAGWRPQASALLDLAGNLGRLRLLIVGSAIFLTAQFSYLISIAVASRLGEGAVTTYSYAYFAFSLVVAILSSSVSMVLAGPVAETWDRDPATLTPHSRAVFRTGLLIIFPTIAAAALVGDDVGAALLGGFTDAEVDRAVAAFLVLTPVVVAAQAIAVPLIGVFAQGRYAATAALSGGVMVLHAALSVVAGTFESVPALAAAAAVSSVMLAGGVLLLLHGRGAREVASETIADVARLGVPAAACFGLPALAFAQTGAAAAGAAALAAGAVLYAGAVVLFMPDYRRLVARLVESARASMGSGRSGSSPQAP